MQWTDSSLSSSESDGTVSPPSGAVMDLSNDTSKMEDVTQTVEYIQETTIVTREVEMIDEGTMTDGVAAGC